MMHIISILKLTKIMVYPIQKVLIFLLDIKKINILIQYSNFANVFLSNSAIKLLKYIGISNNLIDLIDNKRLFYSLIYSLELVELKTLKSYIKTNLTSKFL